MTLNESVHGGGKAEVNVRGSYVVAWEGGTVRAGEGVGGCSNGDDYELLAESGNVNSNVRGSGSQGGDDGEATENEKEGNEEHRGVDGRDFETLLLDDEGDSCSCFAGLLRGMAHGDLVGGSLLYPLMQEQEEGAFVPFASDHLHLPSPS